MSPKLRQQVWDRAGGICECCHLPEEFDVRPFQPDHVIATKHHGESSFENLALACLDCNVHKGPNLSGYHAQTGQIVRLFNPRRDQWSQQFHWDGPWLRGKSVIGEVTIDVLAINRPDRVELRRELIGGGFVFAD